MAPIHEPQFQKLRCAPFHDSLHVDPVGSAACYDGYLCVEVPLPWPRDISEAEPFSSFCDPPTTSLKGAHGTKWRPQGLVPRADPSDAGPEGRVQVSVWSPQQRVREPQGDYPQGRHSTDQNRDTALVGPLSRFNWRVGTGDASALLRRILDGEPPESCEPDSRVAIPSESALYICTHGQRDVCCGSMGTELFAAVEGLESVEVRRCSHTGGHRFASTAVTLPDGYAWAHLDPAIARAVAQRTVHPSAVAGHCRGSTLIDSGPAQVADRHGLCEVGWGWADAHRTIELLGFERSTMATDLRVRAIIANGEERCFEVRVGIERHVPQISCGEISGPEYAVEPVWRVEMAREVC